MLRALLRFFCEPFFLLGVALSLLILQSHNAYTTGSQFTAFGAGFQLALMPNFLGAAWRRLADY